MKQIIIISFLLFFSSCKNSKEVKLYDIEKKYIKIESEVQTDFSFIKDVEYIFLSDSIKIGEIHKVFIDGEFIFITDKFSNSLYLFNIKGEFVNTLDYHGSAKGEYLELTDFSLDSINDRIVILDSKNRKLYTYSFPDFLFISDISLDIIPYRIECINGYLYLYNPLTMNYSSNEKDKKYAVFVYNGLGELVNKYISTNNKLGNVLYINNGFSKSSNTLLMNYKLSRDIHELNHEGVILSYKVEFENCYDEIIQNEVSFDILNLLLNSGYSHNINGLCANKDYLLFRYFKNKKINFVIYSKKRDKILLNTERMEVITASLLSNNIPYFKFPEYSYNNKFVSVIQPIDLKRIYNENLNVGEYFQIKDIANKFLDVEPNDNPIIAIYTFK